MKGKPHNNHTGGNEVIQNPKGGRWPVIITEITEEKIGIIPKTTAPWAGLRFAAQSHEAREGKSN